MSAYGGADLYKKPWIPRSSWSLSFFFYIFTALRKLSLYADPTRTSIDYGVSFASMMFATLTFVFVLLRLANAYAGKMTYYNPGGGR